MRILITGGSGSIGSRLVPILVDRGDDVTVFDLHDKPLAASDAFRSARYIQGQIQCADTVDRVVQDVRPDSIYHLAAILSGGAETESELAWRVNMDGTRNVLEAARRHSIQRVMFPSTVATYGAGVVEPVTEDTPQWPAGLYGMTKVAGERLGVYYHQRFGLDFRCVRLGAMVAPNAPAGGAASAFVCDLYVAAVRDGAYELYVYPESRVPIVWLDDVVDAMIRLHDIDASQLKRRVYNIVGAGPSVAEMVGAVQRRMPEVRFTYRTDPVRADIIESWPADFDTSAAREDWGWSPRVELDYMTEANLDALQKLFARA